MAELGQHCPFPPFSAHIFPSPDPSSLPHPLSCVPLQPSLCQPPGVPSTHLSCSVKSLLPPPLGCLVKRWWGRWFVLPGPDSKKAPHLRHQLPGTYSRAAHHLQDFPQCLHWGSLPFLPTPQQPLPAFLCSRSPARSRWRGGDQQVLRKLTAWLGGMEESVMMEGMWELRLGEREERGQTEWVGT